MLLWGYAIVSLNSCSPRNFAARAVRDVLSNCERFLSSPPALHTLLSVALASPARRRSDDDEAGSSGSSSDGRSSRDQSVELAQDEDRTAGTGTAPTAELAGVMPAKKDTTLAAKEEQPALVRHVSQSQLLSSCFRLSW